MVRLSRQRFRWGKQTAMNSRLTGGSISNRINYIEFNSIGFYIDQHVPRLLMEERRRHPPRRQHCGRRVDFWQAWHEEGQLAKDQADDSKVMSGFHPASRPRHRRARRWREFFHDFTGSWPEEHWALGGRRFSPWHQGQAQFNPFVANVLSKGGGLLPLYVLYLLFDRPHYGNEIMERISRSTEGQWVANPGAIYPLMEMLEKQGLINGDWEDPRKRSIKKYRLTEAGRKEADRLRSIVRPKLEEAIKVLRRLAQELGSVDMEDAG